MSSDTATVIEVTPEQTREMMKIHFISREAAFFWGPPGIGKSALALEEANDRGIAFVDVRLSQMEPTDIRGIPMKIEENGNTTGMAWTPPIIFPRDIDVTRDMVIEAIETKVGFTTTNPKGTNNIHYCKEPAVSVVSINPEYKASLVEHGPDSFVVKLEDRDGNIVAGKIRYTIKGEVEAILAFEEMNSAPPSVLAACYQVVHDRRIGEFELGKKVIIFGMGNHETDRGVTYNMPTPLDNRFTHYNVVHNFNDWQKWAILNNKNPEVIGFLTAFPDRLFDFNSKKSRRGFGTPRSWTRLGNIIDTTEGSGIILDNVSMLPVAVGTVGQASGSLFTEHRKKVKNLPSSEDILSGRVKKLNGKVDASLAFTLTTTLLSILNQESSSLESKGISDPNSPERKEWHARIDNYLTMALDSFQPEVNIMGVRTAVGILKMPISIKHSVLFKQFASKYRDVLIDNE